MKVDMPLNKETKPNQIERNLNEKTKKKKKIILPNEIPFRIRYLPENKRKNRNEYISKHI